MKFIVKPGGCLQGELVVPGDKSISHRAAIIASISEGTTEISNFLQAEDCLHTLNVFKQMGVSILSRDEKIIIEGVGLDGLQASSRPLYFGNSGTGFRLVSGLLCGQRFSSILQGDDSLNKRPMQRIVGPLRQMGACIVGEGVDHGETFPPLRISSVRGLTAIEYEMEIASAQVKSSILLAGLYAEKPTTIIEPRRARDHTEKMLKQFGATLETRANRITLFPSTLKACNVQVPNDISSAAFFIAGAAMHPGSHIVLKQVGVNATRTGIISILKKMGAEITVKNYQDGVEPTADIEVKGKRLTGITLKKEFIVEAIDEFPVLFVAASSAQGVTLFKGLHELRVKESDRIFSMSEGLKKLGVKLDVLKDGLLIHGSQIKGGEVDSFGDHRVAMAFSMAGLIAKETIVVHDCNPIKTSFPQFGYLANSLGLLIEENSFEV